MEFGKYADYMALGYAAMAITLSGMVGWIYWRFRMLFHEQAQIEQLEAEERSERAAESETARPAAGISASPAVK